MGGSSFGGGGSCFGLVWFARFTMRCLAFGPSNEKRSRVAHVLLAPSLCQAHWLSWFVSNRTGPNLDDNPEQQRVVVKKNTQPLL